MVMKQFGQKNLGSGQSRKTNGQDQGPGEEGRKEYVQPMPSQKQATGMRFANLIYKLPDITIKGWFPRVLFASVVPSEIAPTANPRYCIADEKTDTSVFSPGFRLTRIRQRTPKARVETIL
jgi:hypothetical protein